MDDSNDHVLSVWDWQKEERLAEAKVAASSGTVCSAVCPSELDLFLSFRGSAQCSNESVFAADFHPTDSNIVVTCGKSHLYFWTLEKGMLVKKQGLFEVREMSNIRQKMYQVHLDFIKEVGTEFYTHPSNIYSII